MKGECLIHYLLNLWLILPIMAVWPHKPVNWLSHFSHYKAEDPCLLMSDGAVSHLGYTIMEPAEHHGIKLFCLLSHTTPSCNPWLGVFGPFKQYLDEQAMQFITTAWDKATIPANIESRILLLEFLSSTSQVTPMKHLLLVLWHKLRTLQSPVLWYIEMLASSVISEWISCTQYIWHRNTS
jgi:hypothetical protein